MNSLLNLLDTFLKTGFVSYRIPSLGGIFMCYSMNIATSICVNFLGPQAHLKRLVGNRNMKSYVKFLLKIWKAFNMRMWILTIVYSKDIYNNHIGYFLFINLGMEGSD